jgi:hypothetical protein
MSQVFDAGFNERPAWNSALMRKEGKRFFFEKKTQKTLAIW